VFVALDAELNREVALKQIQGRHADDPASRQRFLQEAGITGGLEHPGVVPVYGLGTYADGRPNYAMRFIKGDSLKQAIAAFHADATLKADPGARSLALRKLLRRFTDVCNAMEYAHTRGVLHRDLKPGNVMRGRYGETLVVDWGLAKPLGAVDPGRGGGERPLVPASGGSSETLPGQALGTPAYMSPEQAAGDLERLGPWSDVYSLGATLYCLLTGRAPFERGELRSALRAVQDGEFPRPRALDPSVDPALEAVCLKAMALQPDDRYPSCRALAEDVERWAADEPVSAWREPLPRRARRWTRRHRTAVTGATAALVVGVIGLAAVAVVQTRANKDLEKAYTATTKAKGVAEAALAETSKAKQATDAALVRSEESRKQADLVSTFLVDTLSSPDPSNSGRDVKVVDILDRATQRLEKEFAGAEATRGALLNTLGQTYLGLALYDKAAVMFAKARDVREAVLGPGHFDTLQSRGNLANAHYSAGRLSEAIALQEETLKLREAALGPDHPNSLQARGNLAAAYQEAGRLSEAIALYEATLARMDARLGPGHPWTLTYRNNLANAYRRTGRLSEAVALHEATLERRELRLGPDHPDTLQSRNNLALAYRDAGRVADAIALDEATLKLREVKLGPDHPNTLQTRGNLAIAYLDAGRVSEAVAVFEDALPRQQARLGPDHAYTLSIRTGLASAYEALGRWGEAERLLHTVLASRRKTIKPDSPLLAVDLHLLGRDLLKQSRGSEAEPVFREALAIWQKSTGENWDRYYAMSLLGAALMGQGRYAESERLAVAGYEGLTARAGRVPVPERYVLREAAEEMVRLYDAWGRFETATEWKAKLGLADLPADVFAPP
jgi:tetratricopeptide (TPR) repeat protein